MLEQALTYYEVTNASRSGGEKGSAVRNGRAYCYGKAVNRVAPDKSTPVDGIHSKPPSTSGIMRVLSLMCESRVCPLCEANEGKHVRKGWLFT